MHSIIRAMSLILAFAILAAAPATAQVPPSAKQQAAYIGLHAAAQSDDVTTIKHLLTQNADINARDPYGRTPLMVAVFAHNHTAARVFMAAAANSDLLENDKYDALTIAAVEGDTKMVKLLIAKGAKTGLVTSIYDGTALIAAAHLGHVGVVKALIAGKAPLDHVNNLDWTALIEAIVLGNGGENHTKIVRALAGAGANVNLPDGQGRTPLTLAVARGYGNIIQILKSAGAN